MPAAERLRESNEPLNQVRALLGGEMDLAFDTNGSLAARKAISRVGVASGRIRRPDAANSERAPFSA